jgi:tetratricopeptide (TPR) repeat protein
LGDALTLARQWPEAVKAYDDALASSPSFTPAINAKASSLIAQFEHDLQLNDGLRRQAIGLWRKSLELDADQPEVQTAIERWSRSTSFSSDVRSSDDAN